MNDGDDCGVGSDGGGNSGGGSGSGNGDDCGVGGDGDGDSGDGGDQHYAPNLGPKDFLAKFHKTLGPFWRVFEEVRK